MLVALDLADLDLINIFGHILNLLSPSYVEAMSKSFRKTYLAAAPFFFCKIAFRSHVAFYFP